MKSRNTYEILTLFLNKYEYQILEITGILCGLFIIFVANNFLNTKLYSLVFIFGLLISSLGFVIEYNIKNAKNKAVDKEFSYFLRDLSREYKITKNLSLALSNVSSTNYYGLINNEIRIISMRVSWGESFSDALTSINKNIKNIVIDQCVLLLNIFEKIDVPFDIVLLKISKDINIIKEETQKKKYSSNLFSLSFVFYFIFLFVLLYIDFLVGQNFLWVSSVKNIVTRVFFDNFLLYIALLLAFFTSFVMYSIKNSKLIDILRYVAIFFVITIIMFQVFIPKPDAEDIIIDSINYMVPLHTQSLELEKIISLKSISSRYILENTEINNLYFLQFEKKNCGKKCAEYIIPVSEPTFLNFTIEKENNDFIVYYEKIK